MRVSLTSLLVLSLIVGGSRQPPLIQDASCPALFAGRMPTGRGIYLAAEHGGEPTQLTDSQWDIMPRWSPDGSRIAFASIRGTDMEELSSVAMLGHFMLYTMNADGSNPSRLTGTPLSWFQWSPDGSRIAYVSSHEDERNYNRGEGWVSSAMYVINADGSSVRRLTPIDGKAMFPGRYALGLSVGP